MDTAPHAILVSGMSALGESVRASQKRKIQRFAASASSICEAENLIEIRDSAALQASAAPGFALSAARGTSARMSEHFTPWASLFGGVLIGLAASMLLLVNGRVAGVSGAISNLFSSRAADRGWSSYFLLGLLLSGIIATWFAPSTIGVSPRTPLVIAMAGLLVGVGTTLGNGCTSGHGVCGISRLSLRSVIATCTFVGTAMLTVLAFAWLGGAR